MGLLPGRCQVASGAKQPSAAPRSRAAKSCVETPHCLSVLAGDGHARLRSGCRRDRLAAHHSIPSGCPGQRPGSRLKATASRNARPGRAAPSFAEPGKAGPAKMRCHRHAGPSVGLQDRARGGMQTGRSGARPGGHLGSPGFRPCRRTSRAAPPTVRDSTCSDPQPVHAGEPAARLGHVMTGARDLPMDLPMGNPGNLGSQCPRRAIWWESAQAGKPATPSSCLRI